MNDIQRAIDEYKRANSDVVLLPSDTGYDDSVGVFMATGKPLLVVRPETNEDVVKAVNFARDSHLEIAVRTGGHSQAGHSTNNGGMVIDMRHINSVEIIDRDKGHVRIGGGAIWSDVAAKLGEHGLAISSGDTKTVGVGGLVLSGGIGWMVRKYGLTLDNVLSVELVTADGLIVTASNDQNQDLFWAVRGGGGNFGIATSFDITAQHVGDVYSGMATYDMKDLRSVLTGWRDVMRAAPEELTTMALVMPPNPAFANMPSGIIILICYAGDDETAAMQAIDPLLKLGTMLHSDIERKPYSAVLADAHPPQGVRIITNNAFFDEFSDQMIDTICRNASQILQIRSVGGAMNRVVADATAFAHRGSEVLIVSPTFVPTDASDRTVQELLGPWRAIAATGNGAYTNFFTLDTPEEIAAAYPSKTYRRLSQVKHQYDPTNLFHGNYNIKPTD